MFPGSARLRVLVVGAYFLDEILELQTSYHRIIYVYTVTDYRPLVCTGPQLDTPVLQIPGVLVHGDGAVDISQQGSLLAAVVTVTVPQPPHITAHVPSRPSSATPPAANAASPQESAASTQNSGAGISSSSSPPVPAPANAPGVSNTSTSVSDGTTAAPPSDTEANGDSTPTAHSAPGTAQEQRTTVHAHSNGVQIVVGDVRVSIQHQHAASGDGENDGSVGGAAAPPHGQVPPAGHEGQLF